MKGFKDSTRMRSGFAFGSSAGFTGSTGKTQQVSYTRKIPRRGPAKFAEGGKVPPKKPPPPKPTDTNRGTTIGDVLKGRQKQMAELGLAEGGAVDSSLHGPAPESQLNVEHGPRSGLRPGFTRGGYAAKYAEGGAVVPTRGGGGQPFKQNRNVRASFATSAIASGSPASESKSAMKGRMQSAQDRILGSKFAKGGKIPAGKLARRAATAAIDRHVATPAPRGHKGLKGC